MTTLTVYRPIFGTKHDIDRREGLWKYKGDLQAPKFLEFWSTNGLKLDPSFIDPL